MGTANKHKISPEKRNVPFFLPFFLFPFFFKGKERESMIEPTAQIKHAWNFSDVTTSRTKRKRVVASVFSFTLTHFFINFQTPLHLYLLTSGSNPPTTISTNAEISRRIPRKTTKELDPETTDSRSMPHGSTLPPRGTLKWTRTGRTRDVRVHTLCPVNCRVNN